MADTTPIAEGAIIEAIALCQQTYRTTLNITELLQLPRTPHSTFRLSLQATIHELGNATLQCLGAGILSASEILLRSMLEAYVDLLAASRDENYLLHCEMKHHQEWRKVLIAARNNDNEYLADITEIPHLSDLIQRRTDSITSLVAQGARDLSARERFRMANVPALYDGLYRRLSACSHNSLGELLRRHANERPDNKVDLTMFRDAEGHEEYFIADTLTGLLLGSIEQFKDYLSRDQLDEIETLSATRQRHSREK